MADFAAQRRRNEKQRQERLRKKRSSSSKTRSSSSTSVSTEGRVSELAKKYGGYNKIPDYEYKKINQKYGTSYSGGSKSTYQGEIDGKVYSNLTKEELEQEKLHSTTQAKELRNTTAERAKKEEIRRKLSQGEVLTENEQFYIATGRGSTIDNLNKAIEQNAANPANPSITQGNIRNIQDYNKQAKDYQSQKKFLEANTKGSQATTFGVNTPFSKTERSFIDKKTTPQLKKEDSTATSRFITDFAKYVDKKDSEAIQKNKDLREFYESKGLYLSGLDSKESDGAFTGTFKALGRTGYALTLGVADTSTPQALFQTGVKGVLYGSAGIASIYDSKVRELFFQSTKEQTIGAADAITPISVPTLLEEGKIEYDPQGAANLVIASASASVAGKARLNARKIEVKSGTIKEGVTRTSFNKAKGTTTTKQFGSYQSKGGQTVKYQVKTVIDKAGQGTVETILKNPKGKVLSSSKNQISQTVKVDRVTSQTANINVKSTIKGKGIKPTTEELQGTIKQSSLKPTGSGKNAKITSTQKLEGSVKIRGQTNQDYNIIKQSVAKSKGTLEVVETVKGFDNLGNVGRVKVIESTFDPRFITEVTTKSTRLSPYTPTVKESLIQAFKQQSKKGSLAFSRSSGDYAGRIIEINPTQPIVQPTTQVTAQTLLKGGTLFQPSPQATLYSQAKFSSLTPPLLFSNVRTPTISGGVEDNFAANLEKPSLKVNSIVSEVEQSEVRANVIEQVDGDFFARTRSRSGSNTRTQNDVDSEPIPQVGTETLLDSIPQEQTSELPLLSSPGLNIINKPALIFTKTIDTPKFKDTRERIERKGFDVFTRKQGKLLKLNVKPLSKTEARNKGAFITGTTARASFRVVESSSPIGESFKGKGNLKDFKKGKGGWFVEKREKRISSLGELREITFKGIAATRGTKKTKKKKKLKGIFGGL